MHLLLPLKVNAATKEAKQTKTCARDLNRNGVITAWPSAHSFNFKHVARLADDQYHV